MLAPPGRDASPQFRVYNLCSERCYTADTFEKGGAKPELGGGELGGQCAYYPFDDHNPAPLETIKACCDDMAAFLDADAANVVAVHCKAGKVSCGTGAQIRPRVVVCFCRVANSLVARCNHVAKPSLCPSSPALLAPDPSVPPLSLSTFPPL